MAKTNKKHSKAGYIFGSLAAILVLGAILFMQYRSRIRFYADETITGNTSMNLINGGRFALDGNTIYFANPLDGNTLYSMDTDLNHIKKLTNDTVSYINAAAPYLFYTRRNDRNTQQQNALLTLSNTGLYRTSTKGTNLKQLYKDPTQALILYGNHIFYQHYNQKEGLQFYRIDIKGNKDTLLLDEGVMPAAVIDNRMLYTGADTDHQIHSMNLDGSDAKVIYAGNCTSLAYNNGYLYYMDMDNNYALCRIQPDGSGNEVLLNSRLATYNVSEDNTTVYYQVDNGTDNGLYSLNINTGASKMLRTGNYNFLHIIDSYLFFEEYDGSAAYVMDTTNEQIESFNPPIAKD